MTEAPKSLAQASLGPRPFHRIAYAAAGHNPKAQRRIRSQTNEYHKIPADHATLLGIGLLKLTGGP